MDPSNAAGKQRGESLTRRIKIANGALRQALVAADALVLFLETPPCVTEGGWLASDAHSFTVGLWKQGAVPPLPVSYDQPDSLREVVRSFSA